LPGAQIFVILLAIWFLIRGPSPDPTVTFFKRWLNADPATNPVAYDAPLRDDGKLLYVSTQEADQGTDVRAAMTGVISKVSDHSVELVSDVNKEGVHVTIDYSGLSSVTVHAGDRVVCGAKIGTMERALRVHFANNNGPLAPPQILRPAPSAWQGFRNSWETGENFKANELPPYIIKKHE